jgi:hypothetical protein
MFASLVLEAQSNLRAGIDRLVGLAVPARAVMRNVRDDVHPDAAPFEHLRDASIALDAHIAALQRARDSIGHEPCERTAA